MTQEQINALMGLMIFIGVLLAVIIGVIVASQLKKKKPEELSAEKKSEIEIKSYEVLTQAVPAPIPQEKSVKDALSQTRNHIWGRIEKIFSGKEASSQQLDDLEEVLYTSDLSPKLVQNFISVAREKLSPSELSDSQKLKSALSHEVDEVLASTEQGEKGLFSPQKKPFVIMVVGVNGAGKTTTIGKLSARFLEGNKKVLVAAGDTFRAAAQNQLRTWADRAQVEIFAPENVKDPSALAFDAVAKAQAQNFDVVIVDTAGRLHTQAHLMEELKKIKRVIQKQNADAPHEILIVLDANAGQNALVQAREYHQALGLTGAIITKMDGSAKGGVAVSLVSELGIPVRLIGVGEKISDLRSFSPKEYTEALFN